MPTKLYNKLLRVLHDNSVLMQAGLVPAPEHEDLARAAWELLSGAELVCLPEFRARPRYITQNYSNFVDIIAPQPRPLKRLRDIAPFGKFLSNSQQFLGNSRRAPLVLCFSLFLLCGLSVILDALPTYAAATITLTVDSTSQSFEMMPTASGSAFGTSGTIRASVTTNNYTGYKLSITGPNDNRTLVGESSSSNTLASITSAITASDFSNTTNSTYDIYDNKWGFLPSKLNGTANTNYQPSPLQSTATTIDTTTIANTTANTYDFSIAARVNTTQAKDTYTGSFILTAVANPAAYEITYNGNGATANIPTTQTGNFSSGTTIAITSTTPTMTNYTFKGWCPGTVTNYSTCSTTAISSGGSYTFSNPSDTALNQITLTAMWKLNYSVSYNASTGGSGAPSTQSGSLDYNGIFTLSSTTPTRSGYDFNGWCTVNPSGGEGCSGTPYSAGQTITLTSPLTLTLYARWKQQIDCTIMQNIEACKSTLLSGTLATTGSTMTMTDSRDSTTYTVGKLADGNIWLLENLRLVGSKTLTSADSNVSSDFTLPASISSGFDSYTTAQINSGSMNYSDSYGKFGVYYNYCAASAGSNCAVSGSGNFSPTQDICPKGWKLPTGGDSGQFQALYTAYRSNYTNFRNALKLPLSGYYSSSANFQGSYGHFWSSTYYDGSLMYLLYLSSSSVYPQNVDTRYVGRSVRCVAQ